MSTENEKNNLAVGGGVVLIAVAVAVIVIVWWVLTSKNTSAKSVTYNGPDNPDFQCADSKDEGCTLRNSKNEPNFIFSEQWQLPHENSGSFFFNVNGKGNGLIIYLVSQPTITSETKGYAIVLDDQQKSYVNTDVEMVGRAAGPGINRDFTLDVPTDIVVCYGSSRLSVYARNEKILEVTTQNEPVPYFGFGLLRNDKQGVIIKDIKVSEECVQSGDY